MIRAVQDIEFWRERLREFKDPVESIIPNFAWEEVNKLHKSIIEDCVRGSVLDIGCGPGRIAHWFTDEQYTGIDFVPEYVEIAKNRHSTKRFLIVDAIKPLPFADKEFDWGICVSFKGTLFNGDAHDPTNTWRPVGENLSRICKRLLILEYSRKYAEVW